ncbi:myocilin [Antennarius striatus]|uniref:myocilin n=1 Tax=Antennarius striatus TaxID=241820 RepID=UPI0035AFBFF1
MFLLISVCVCSLLLRGDAQDQAVMWRGNDRTGRCQYTFTVPSPMESSCAQMTGPEMDSLKARLNMLEVTMSRLTATYAGSAQTAGDRGQSEFQEALNRVMGERNMLQRERERLEQELESLRRRMDDMRREIEFLRSRQCHPQSPMAPPSSSMQGSGLMRTAGSSAWQYRPPGFQELKATVTEVPAPRSEDSTGCGELISVGEPITHRKADNIEGKYGVWMQDPEPVSPYSSNMIWRIDTIGSDVRKLFGYEDMEQLSKGFPSKVLLLPEQVESTGATVYRGSLYYQRRRSRTLIRYDLASESIAARRDLPHAGFHGQFPYSWGGYTDIDLAVDDNGLWAIYSTSKAKGAIVISKLDPHSLEVKKSWETNIRKSSVANSFMICGRLYTVASYTAPDTLINYMYDTATSQGKALRIPFKNLYRYNSMIDYNRAQRKLFAWDNYHMVSYDLRLGRQHSM